MKITIRKAELEDLQTLQALFKQTIEHACAGDYNSEQIAAWTSSIENTERWQRLISYQYCIVAEFEGSIVGFAALDDGDYVDFLYVHHDYLRKGIASRLFDELKLESLREGFYKLHADVSITARPFFESKGFELEKENKKDLRGIELINFRMKEV